MVTKFKISNRNLSYQFNNITNNKMSNQDSEYSRQSHSSSTKNREDEEKVVGVQEQPHSTATHTDRADHPCGATAPS